MWGLQQHHGSSTNASSTNANSTNANSTSANITNGNDYDVLQHQRLLERIAFLSSRITFFPLAQIGGVYHSIIWEV
jgi:hypothetical protein